jgi:hypothetical protein
MICILPFLFGGGFDVTAAAVGSGLDITAVLVVGSDNVSRLGVRTSFEMIMVKRDRAACKHANNRANVDSVDISEHQL